MASGRCGSKVWQVIDVEVRYGKFRCRSKVWQVLDVEVRHGK